MDDKDGSEELPLEPEPAPGRVSSAGATTAPAGAPLPRTTRFGEGAEGAGLRRERGMDEPRGGGNFFARTGQFFRDVRTEMRRVSWPTATEVKNTTIITIVAVIFFAIYLFVVDQAIVQLGRFGLWLLSLLRLA